MKQAQVIRQRHMISNTSKKGYKGFHKLQQEYSKNIPEYLKSMVDEKDDYKTAMSLPNIKINANDDEQFNEEQK